MPSQRPFFVSFFSAFRAHSAMKSATASSASASAPAPPSSNPTTSALASQATASAPRAISTSAKQPTSPLAAVATAAFSPPQPRYHSSSPGATAASPLPMAHAPNTAFGGRRRGSDSSTEGPMGAPRAGYQDAMGGEKWFVGGRTAAGEERFYKLAMARRERSGDRASLDRMSL